MINETGPETGTAEERAGFCQNCGKALNQNTIRKVGTAVYCEPCLAARLRDVPSSTAGAQPGYAPVNQGAGPQIYSGNPLMGGPPNPALAALLGLIPGVGAMYNEQYAKGIVHLGVFAVLVSLANDVNGVFGIFIAGWVFYMAIEAHHTARARRDGLPLPNPFGLNDIGERLGFGRAWAGAAAAPIPTPAAPTTPISGAAPPSAAEANWGTPVNQYGYAAPPVTSVPPYAPPFAAIPGMPPPYAPVPPIPPPVPLPPANRFPTGAVWLIGLGTLFLLGNTEIFRGFRTGVLVGFGLIALSLWLFVRNMTLGGQTLADDGSPLYQMRAVRAVRGSVWVLLVGLLIVLNDFGLIRWHNSWPYFLILAGVMAIVERAASNATATSVYAPPPPATPQTNPVTDTAKGGN